MSDAAQRWQRKIDHKLRALWERVPESDRPGHSVRVLLRFTGPVGLMEELGVQVNSVAGDIASGTIVLAELPTIGNASRIVFVESAQPLTFDA